MRADGQQAVCAGGRKAATFRCSSTSTGSGSSRRRLMISGAGTVARPDGWAAPRRRPTRPGRVGQLGRAPCGNREPPGTGGPGTLSRPRGRGGWRGRRSRGSVLRSDALS
jgi:hypothetical protein